MNDHVKTRHEALGLTDRLDACQEHHGSRYEMTQQVPSPETSGNILERKFNRSDIKSSCRVRRCVLCDLAIRLRLGAVREH